MPITIPNRDKVTPLTTPLRVPNAMKTGMINPCPVRVSPTGTASSGVALMERTVDPLGVAYAGYSVRSNAPIGASPDDEQFAPVRHCAVGGFAGVSPGVDVYIDPTAAPSPEVDFSGITHTNTGGTARKIGYGMTAGIIWFE